MTAKRFENERGIMFKGHMVQAIRNTKIGSWPAEPIDPNKPYKWQTRRVILPQPKLTTEPGEFGTVLSQWIVWDNPVFKKDAEKGNIKEMTSYCHYGKKGHYLYVRERYANVAEHIGSTPIGSPPFDMVMAHATHRFRAYESDWGAPPESLGIKAWLPATLCPRDASRYVLKIMQVRFQRIQEITRTEVYAEGLDTNKQVSFLWVDDAVVINKFKIGWDAINGKRGYSWEKNPYVWSIDFMRVE